MAAGLSPSEAIADLQKLPEAGTLSVAAQGKFRYYRLADEEVAGALETLAFTAGYDGFPRVRYVRCAAKLPTQMRQATTPSRRTIRRPHSRCN
jgi:hypothetical protein